MISPWYNQNKPLFKYMIGRFIKKLTKGTKGTVQKIGKKRKLIQQVLARKAIKLGHKVDAVVHNPKDLIDMPSAFEEKWYEETPTASTITTNTGTVIFNSIHKIAQGTASDNRIGRRIILSRIQVKGMVTLPMQTSVDRGIAFIRVVLLIDKQANGSGGSEVLPFADSAYDTFMSLNYSDRYKVLRNEEFILESKGNSVTTGGTYATNPAIAIINWNIPCNIPVMFSSTTGAVTELRSNNVYIVAFSSRNDYNPVPVCSLNCRVRFHDA